MHPSKTTTGWIAALVLATATANAVAHEFWIEPTSFRPEPADTVGLFLKVGQSFRGEAVPRLPGVFRTLEVATTEGRFPIEGALFADPAGSVSWASGARSAVAAYTSEPYPTTLPAEAFEAYLRSEGLDRVAALRATRGASGREGRERFSRCAKALLGRGEADLFARPLGLELELVPDSDVLPSVGETLAVRLLYEGHPIEGVQVSAWSRRDTAPSMRSRTDANGRVSVIVRDEGPWLVSAVHMVEAAPGSGSDWASVWASLTFSPEPPARAAGGNVAR